VTEAERAALDLSRWGAALNASETVRDGTLTRFVAAFGGRGFDRKALCPCYGLAEATLIVTGDAPGAPLVAKAVSRSGLGRGAVGQPPRDAVASSPSLAGGARRGGHGAAIVDRETRTRMPAGAIGEIWIRGPAVARSYWAEARTQIEPLRASPAGEVGDDYVR